MSERTLYRFEAKGIQAFVFATNKLREVVGGSALVVELTRLDEGGLLREALLEAGVPPAESCLAGSGGRVLMAAAGGATILLDEPELRSFAVSWPRLVSRLAPGLQLVQAWVRCEGEPEPSHYQELFVRLKQARTAGGPVLPQATPILDRAPRTGLPAVRHKSSKGDDWLDAGTAVRQKTRNLYKAEWGLLAEEALPEGWDFAKDEDAISGSERSYLAVVHADGNGIGAAVVAAPDKGAFSRELADATRRAVKDAIGGTLAHLLDNKRPGPLPFRPLIVGGDDVTVICRADLALPFARRFCRAFHKHTLKAKLSEGGRGLTASAGVVFIRSRHPFRLAYDQAEELADEAKATGRLAKEAHQLPLLPPFVAVHRVTTSLSESPGDRRGDGPRMGLGPYLADRDADFDQIAKDFPYLEDMEELAAEFKDRSAPSGALRKLVSLAQRDPGAAQAALERVRDVAEGGSPSEKRAWTRLTALADRALPEASERVWTQRPRLDRQGTALDEDVEVMVWGDAYALSTVVARTNPEGSRR